MYSDELKLNTYDMDIVNVIYKVEGSSFLYQIILGDESKCQMSIRWFVLFYEVGKLYILPEVQGSFPSLHYSVL